MKGTTAGVDPWSQLSDALDFPQRALSSRSLQGNHPPQWVRTRLCMKSAHTESKEHFHEAVHSWEVQKWLTGRAQRDTHMGSHQMATEALNEELLQAWL